MEEVLSANAGSFLIAEAVRNESLFVHVVVDGQREKEPVELDSLLASGVLTVVAPEDEAEFTSLIEFTQQLDAGEAMTCALALHREYRIATDDRKTIRLVGNRMPIVGTLDLIRSWVDRAGVDPRLVREVLAAIEDRGYVPGANHIHHPWWTRMRRQWPESV